MPAGLLAHLVRLFVCSFVRPLDRSFVHSGCPASKGRAAAAAAAAAAVPGFASGSCVVVARRCGLLRLWRRFLFACVWPSIYRTWPLRSLPWE